MTSLLLFKFSIASHESQFVVISARIAAATGLAAAPGSRLGKSSLNSNRCPEV